MKTSKAFEAELSKLINQHSIENVADTPDFVLAEMLCCMIDAIGPSIKKTLDWHGCNSVCHPLPDKPERRLRACPNPLCPSKKHDPIPPGWEVPHVVHTPYNWPGYYFVQCNCGISGPIRMTEADAKEAWGYE